MSKLSRRWYDMGGLVVTNTIIGDSWIINLIIDGFLKPDYLVPLLAARGAPTQKAMDVAVSMTNVLFIPFRGQGLAKTLCLVMLFSSAMPILLPLLFVYCVTAIPVDHLHLFVRFAPPPLTNDLTFRWIISNLLPLFLILHCIFGCLFYIAAEVSAGRTVAQALVRGPLLLYLVFTVAVTGGVAYQMRRARAAALRNTVLTPWQLCCAPCVVDDGFHLAGMAATEKVAGMVLALPDADAAKGLYCQPTTSIGDGQGQGSQKQQAAWRSHHWTQVKSIRALGALGSFKDLGQQPSAPPAPPTSGPSSPLSPSQQPGATSPAVLSSDPLQKNGEGPTQPM